MPKINVTTTFIIFNLLPIRYNYSKVQHMIHVLFASVGFVSWNESIIWFNGREVVLLWKSFWFFFQMETAKLYYFWQKKKDLNFSLFEFDAIEILIWCNKMYNALHWCFFLRKPSQQILNVHVEPTKLYLQGGTTFFSLF